MKTWCHVFNCHIGISRYINLSGHSSSHPPPSLQAITDHVTCCITEQAETTPNQHHFDLRAHPHSNPPHSPCPCCHSLPLSVSTCQLLLPPSDSRSADHHQHLHCLTHCVHTVVFQNSRRQATKSANSIRKLRHITDSTDFDTRHDMTHRTYPL